MNPSENMSAIRSKGMKPEMAVRSLVHRLGYRFLLHRKDLPGKPDLVFASRRKVIFVHGCFWHSHGCRYAHTSKSNLGYWMSKLARNQARDVKTIEVLKAAGWNPLIVWECETKDQETIKKQLASFLNS